MENDVQQVKIDLSNGFYSTCEGRESAEDFLGSKDIECVWRNDKGRELWVPSK